MNRLRRALRAVVTCALLATTCAVAPGVARADDPRATWLEGRAYEKTGTFVAAGRTVEAYTAKPDEEAKGLDLHRFLVVEGDDVKLALTASVEEAGEPSARVRLAWVQADVEAERVDVEVADAKPAETFATARRLVEDALAAWTAWTDAAALLSRAGGEEADDTRRALALAATRALERAFDAHPDHAGVLHDLLAAYELLLPLEAGTDRGANVSFLWRDRLLAYRARFARTEDEYVGVAGRLLATCGLAEGCYALAALGASIGTTRGDETYAGTVVAALTALGQQTQEAAGDATVHAARGELRLVVTRCPGEPAEDGVPFHRLTALTVPSDGAASGIPTPVWYSLTDERTGERHRWALYGNVGGTRRLLRLYGPTEPDPAEAREAILDAVGAALGVERRK